MYTEMHSHSSVLSGSSRPRLSPFRFSTDSNFFNESADGKDLFKFRAHLDFPSIFQFSGLKWLEMGFLKSRSPVNKIDKIFWIRLVMKICRHFLGKNDNSFVSLFH